MTSSGDAAEQIVRMSLEGVEVVAKITGAAAKEIATFLVAALKNNNKLKTKGKARLTSMLKSGKALEIFSVRDSDLRKFMEGAKQYGIVYCVLRDKKHDKDGMCDILVKADDAPKISRVVERFKFAKVDMAKIESELVQSRAERGQMGAGQPAPERGELDKLLDDLLPPEAGRAKPATEKSIQREAPAQRNPEAAKTAKSRPSEPTSESRSKSAGVTSSEKPSVKQELREIKAARAKQEADAPKRDEKAADKPKARAASTHKQPQNSGGKSKKVKVR